MFTSILPKHLLSTGMQRCISRAPTRAQLLLLSTPLPQLRGSRTLTASANSSSEEVYPTAEVQVEPSRRRRRKLFTRPDDDSFGDPSSTQSVAPAAPPQQGSQRNNLQDLQQPPQQRWWQDPSAASSLCLYVFWDLDNLKPGHWRQADNIVKSLRSVLQQFGRVCTLQAYASSRTLVREVDMAGVQEQLEEEADQLRCPLCGRRCSSFDALRKHFRELHEREHNKRLRGSKKYATTTKAARVRDARRFYGTPKKNRSGRRGQMVKALLNSAGVNCIEVSSQRQAADDAIKRHMTDLIHRLKTTQYTPPPSSAAAEAAAKGYDSALQQAVLVIVSDDRGFARSVVSWLRSGAAGALLVTTRGRAGWQQPLAGAGGGSMMEDVACCSWDQVVGSLDDFGDDDSCDDDDADDDVEDEFHDYDPDEYGGMDPCTYEWMLSQGYLWPED